MKKIAPLQLFTTVLLLLCLAACKKEKTNGNMPAPPEKPGQDVEYFDLNDFVVKHKGPVFYMDFNRDGRRDVAFKTQLVGDPVRQEDKMQFLVESNIDSRLPVNEQEQIPVMDKSQRIMTGSFNGYHWFNVASVLLMQKVLSNTQPPQWEGGWINADYNYVPYQIVENDRRLNGWIALSADTKNEQVILHKAALYKTERPFIQAGH